MSDVLVTVAIPTLAASEAWRECLAALGQQSWHDFEVILIDNSGRGLVRSGPTGASGVRVLANRENAGFGAAINQAFHVSSGRYLATLNDDAVPSRGWLDALVGAMEANSDVGMCASQIRLAGTGELDSAGMLICGDGSSKQRGHTEPPARYSRLEEVLCPSGCAALYRRKMLESIGLFDERFFLYCEDTDLGLRARWAGWRCLYVPEAIVEHAYSHSAGRASTLKAYYVERNRLFVLAKNFPATMLLRAPFVSLARYLWHAVSIATGRGMAARFRRDGNSPLRLAGFVLRAHLALLQAAGFLYGERRFIRRSARITSRDFRSIVRRYGISARRVGRL